MQVNISGVALHLEVQPGDTTADLRRAITAQTGMSTDELRLLYLGFELENARVLGAYNITNDCELFCFPVRRRPTEDLATALTFKGRSKSKPVLTLKTAASAPPGTMASLAAAARVGDLSGSSDEEAGAASFATARAPAASRSRAELPSPGTLRTARRAAAVAAAGGVLSARGIMRVPSSPTGSVHHHSSSPSRMSPTRARGSPVPTVLRARAE